MNEAPKDSEKKEKGQQFTPTDWDWVMFLSGEINAIKTRSDRDWGTIIAISMAVIAILIACMGILFSVIDNIIYTTIVGIFIAVIFIRVGCPVYRTVKMGPETKEIEEIAEPLEKLRNDTFNRLNDPNKILRDYLDIVGKRSKKDDKTK